MERRTEYRDGVMYLITEDGTAYPLADVMKFNYPDMDFDPATGAATGPMPPPRADAPQATTGPTYKLGDVGRSAGNENLSAAYDALGSAMQPGTYDPIRAVNNYVGNMGAAGLLGVIGAGEKLGGYAADALGAGYEALGGERWQPGGAAGALYGDMAAGVQAAGVGPEARMLDAMGLLGVGRSVRDAAKTTARGFLADETGAVRLMGGGTADPTITGWTFRDMRKPDLSREDNKRLQSMFDRTAWQEVELPISRMIATQPTVNADFAVTRSSEGRLPTVVQKNNELFVRDGHHRLVKAAEAGNTKARVALLNLDPRTETPLLDYRKPPPWTAADDALLAELMSMDLPSGGRR
jgi:hypothetical protein